MPVDNVPWRPGDDVPWNDALCAEFGVDRTFVDRKAAPVKEEWKGYGAGAGAGAGAQ